MSVIDKIHMLKKILKEAKNIVAWQADIFTDLNVHKGNASAHHAKTGDNEVYGLLPTGADAAKPAAGIVDRWYFATDTLILYRDNGTSWVEAARGETAIRLAQLVEKAHGSLTGIGANDHHTKFTITEHDTTTRHPLGTVVPHDALASLTERAHSSLTGIGVSDHHTKYTDAEAKAAAVQAGAITNGVTKAPTHDAVYDVKTMVEAHKDRHDPEDGADALDTAVPVKVGAANAEGSSHSLARADHVHEREHVKYTDVEAVAAAKTVKVHELAAPTADIDFNAQELKGLGYLKLPVGANLYK